MVGVSGIRGVIGVGMTPEVVLLWSGGFGSWVKGGKVLVGRDSRPTGKMISLAVKSALSAAGCDVEDLGVVTTPAAAYAVKQRGAAGGIIITASHNPQEWNALKFVRHDGRMLTAADNLELARFVSEGPLRSASWDKLGAIRSWDGAASMHINAILGMGNLDLEMINGKKFKVAIDCVNGAGSDEYPQLLEALGCEVVRIHSDGSGIFNRPPEPLPDNLRDLSKLVTSERCAIGFAVDPDGDRLAVVDENGVPIGEELTLAIATIGVLADTSGPVVVNSLTSNVIEDIAKLYNSECMRTKVGEANVSAKMYEVGAVIGGEGNGGVIYPVLQLVRDSGAGMAIILNLLASRKKKISQIVGELPKYSMVKTSMPLGDINPVQLMDSIAKSFDHDLIIKIDGVRKVTDDGWVQVRPSNTEPILRIFAESTNPEKAQELVADMIDKLKIIIATGSNNDEF